MSDDETPPLDETPSDAAAPERATPVYDQAFFLDLARPRADTDEARAEARERWNAWRRDPANEGVRVTFEGVDFRVDENRGISFDGFKFGDEAEFSRAIFCFDTQFRGAVFRDSARFEGATFCDVISFCGAIFGKNTRFEGSLFFGNAFFDDSMFGDFSWFCGVVFKETVSFKDAKFGDLAVFSGTMFGSSALFVGSKFGRDANFSAIVGRTGILIEEIISKWLSDPNRIDYMKARRGRYEVKGLSSRKFLRISFAGAHFRGSVRFDLRSFERPANFTNVRFDQPPDFDGATNLQRIDFTGAIPRTVTRRWLPHGWTTDSNIVVRWRALRSLIEGTKNHDFERDLYIEERRGERGVNAARKLKQGYGAFAGHLLWIAVMALYGLFSDYGRSWMRPAFWLGVVLLLFHGFGTVDGITALALAERRAIFRADAETVKAGQGVAFALHYDEAIKLYAVANSIPFVGPLTIDGEVKKFLFCGEPAPPVEAGKPQPPSCVPLPPAALQIATIFQNLLSIVLVFFIGLALRNYFRVK